VNASETSVKPSRTSANQSKTSKNQSKTSKNPSKTSKNPSITSKNPSRTCYICASIAGPYSWPAGQLPVTFLSPVIAYFSVNPSEFYKMRGT
jgi:hypothetical protein